MTIYQYHKMVLCLVQRIGFGRLWLCLLLLLIAVSCSTALRPAFAKQQQIGLFTTLPILWQESADLRANLNPQNAPHWALAVLRQNGDVRPLNSLGLHKADKPLSGVTLLIMAQPRPLAPHENVALDKWVSGGGRVLLFADPMLTAETAFALGDRRRPQDVAMLSPILMRWGLELTFDDEAEAGEAYVAWPGTALLVNLPGQFQLRKGSQNCNLVEAGLGVRCKIGKGQVLAVADAAMLEDRKMGAPVHRPEMLNTLIQQALTND